VAYNLFYNWNINLNVMKKFSFYTGILFLTFVFCWIPYKSNSQDIKLSKQEQKEARKAELFANFQSLDTLIEKRTFVLEADFLQNQYGNLIPVTSVLNFIKIDSPKVVLQTGSNYGQGYNDVGGVTAVGDLNSWKITRDVKHLSYTIFFSVTTNIGAYDVLIMIGANNSATATITGLSRGKLIYQGNIVAIYNSSVYKGRETL
jgi:hypothetical protein